MPDRNPVRRSVRITRNERGVALVATLLVLVALTALVAILTMRTMSEKNVTVNHRVANRSMYAADSGTEAAMQQITAYAKVKLDSMALVWAGNGAIIRNPSTLFPAGGLSTAMTNGATFNAATVVTFEDSTLQLQSQAYNYHYVTTSTGTYKGGSKRVITEGRLRVSATRGSFADYLIFTNTHLTGSGGAIWFNSTGNFDGRVHTNGEFRFAYQPTFHDLASSVNGKAWYYGNGTNVELAADRNGTTDVPNFYGGFHRSEPTISLPTNSFSQERAALGGNPADTSQPTNTEINTALGTNVTNPSGPVPNGVYLPNSGGWLTGGIYTVGDCNLMKMSVDGSHNQVFQIKDASDNTTTITVNETTQTTTVVAPSGTSTTYNGIPRGCTYVKGRVNDLRGPDRTSGGAIVPAVARDHQMSIVATGDVIIQRDIAYEDYNSGQNVLGVFSSGGDIRIGTSAPNEVHVDAYVMAAATNKVFSVDNYNSGSYRGQVHLRGGMVTNYYGAFGTFSSNGSQTGYGRDFRYDRRGFVPPYYPLTSRYIPDQPEPQVLAWREVYN